MASERIQRQIDRLLDEAEDAVTQGDWAVVSDRAGKVLALSPENQDALTYLAAAERALGASALLPTTSLTTPTPPPTPATTQAQPTSFANGRYQVKRFLGEGGKKKVYLAHDTTLDREVAFALIKTDGLRPPAPVSSVKHKPWVASAPMPTSSPSSTSEKSKASPTWSPS